MKIDIPDPRDFPNKANRVVLYSHKLTRATAVLPPEVREIAYHRKISLKAWVTAVITAAWEVWADELKAPERGWGWENDPD